VARKSTVDYRFGDLLGLARQSWITQMASGLAAKGYGEYRRSDAAAVRQLQRGPMSIGRLGTALGVTRQAARKVADGLERRGFATVARDEVDARQVKVVLTSEGDAYAPGGAGGDRETQPRRDQKGRCGRSCGGRRGAVRGAGR
jgi:Mn-dependent DtxR family transcriptional regulator